MEPTPLIDNGWESGNRPYGEEDYRTYDPETGQWSLTIAQTSLPTGEDGFSWSEILANFGYYPPALASVAAAVARPTLANIRAVEAAYQRGGYDAPGPLMDWLWSRYYDDYGGVWREAPLTIASYWPLLAIGAVLLLSRRSR